MHKSENERNEARFELIQLDQLEPNVGQLEGLPSNPRQITDSKMDLLKQNILTGEENELRGLKQISKEQFVEILKCTRVNESVIIH